MSNIKKECDLCDSEAVQGVKVLGVESWFCRDCCSTVTVLSPPKFPVKVYTYHGGGKMETAEYYDLTEKELESGKYCIFACGIYFKDSIPKELWYEIDCGWVELYDIWNYECVEWWEWPQELKEIMYAKVPKSRPEEEDENEYTCGEKCECTHCQRNRPTYEEEEESK